MHRLALALDQLDQISDMLQRGKALTFAIPMLRIAMPKTDRQHPIALSQHRNLRRPEAVVT
ncbi:hypothetical protein D3C80_1677030 [compost metagenome]